MASYRKFELKIDSIIASTTVIVLVTSVMLITYIVRMILDAPNNNLYQLISFLGWSGPDN